MKSMETINNTPNSMELPSTGGEAASPGSPSIADLNQRRRRLVRGAAAVAPLVLTLRSGALAAASCTGVKILDVTLDQQGKVLDQPPGVVAALNPTDVCYVRDSMNVCPEYTLPGHQKVSSGTQIGQLTQDFQHNFYCGNTGADFVQFTRVSILSSASASSLTGHG